MIISDEHRPSASWNTAERCAGIRAVDGCVTVDGADALEPYWKARYPDRSTP